VRSRLACLGLFAFALAGCAGASTSNEEAPSASQAPALDGAYQASSGPIAWAGFRGNDYVTWSSDSSCSDPATAPATCGDEGTFTVDAARKTLTLTSNTARVSVYDLNVLASSSSAGDTTPQNLVSTEKIADDSPVTPIVNSFWMGNSTNVQANLFTTVRVLCQVAGQLIHPLPTPAIVPIVQPPAITRQQCGKS
jgi:hypothetical protein